MTITDERAIELGRAVAAWDARWWSAGMRTMPDRDGRVWRLSWKDDERTAYNLTQESGRRLRHSAPCVGGMIPDLRDRPTDVLQEIFELAYGSDLLPDEYANYWSTLLEHVDNELTELADLRRGDLMRHVRLDADTITIYPGVKPLDREAILAISEEITLAEESPPHTEEGNRLVYLDEYTANEVYTEIERRSKGWREVLHEMVTAAREETERVRTQLTVDIKQSKESAKHFREHLQEVRVSLEAWHGVSIDDEEISTALMKLRKQAREYKDSAQRNGSLPPELWPTEEEFGHMLAALREHFGENSDPLKEMRLMPGRVKTLVKHVAHVEETAQGLEGLLNERLAKIDHLTSEKGVLERDLTELRGTIDSVKDAMEKPPVMGVRFFSDGRTKDEHVIYVTKLADEMLLACKELRIVTQAVERYEGESIDESATAAERVRGHLKTAASLGRQIVSIDEKLSAAAQGWEDAERRRLLVEGALKLSEGQAKLDRRHLTDAVAARDEHVRDLIIERGENERLTNQRDGFLTERDDALAEAQRLKDQLGAVLALRREDVVPGASATTSERKRAVGRISADQVEQITQLRSQVEELTLRSAKQTADNLTNTTKVLAEAEEREKHAYNRGVEDVLARVFDKCGDVDMMHADDVFRSAGVLKDCDSCATTWTVMLEDECPNCPDEEGADE